jgi:hypothetical protein
MRTQLLYILFGLSLAIPAAAQDTARTKTELQTRTNQKGAELLAQPRSKTAPNLTPKRSKVSVGGVIGELIQLRHPVTVLGQPEDTPMAAPTDQVYRDPATEQPKGFVLLSIRF